MIKRGIINKKNKKGVSVVIGYILLITFVLFLGVIIYNWMKTYVPKEELNCPDSVSLFIKDYWCDSTQLNLTLKNNGMFNVGGYFIRISNVSDKLVLPTIDLSQNLIDGGSKLPPTGVKFSGSENSLVPNYDESHLFDFSEHNQIYFIEIIPLRWQEHDRRERIVTCKDSILREDLVCP
jgi:FlaG/FlaF family flagellin (archaellin)